MAFQAGFKKWYFSVLRIIQHRNIFHLFLWTNILRIFRFCTMYIYIPFMFPVALKCLWLPALNLSVLRQAQPARHPRDNWLWRGVRWFPLVSLTEWRGKPHHTLHHSDEAQREGLGAIGRLQDSNWKWISYLQTHQSLVERQSPVQNDCCEQGWRIATKRALTHPHSQTQET